MDEDPTETRDEEHHVSPHQHNQHEQHEHDLGLGHDLPRLMGRRRLLGLLAGAGVVTVTGCAAAATGTGTTSRGASATAAAASGVGEIPQETAGPFPGDGSNGPNVLTESGVVRSDIRSSFGTLSGTAAGVPLAVELTVVDANGGTPLPGSTVYAWHCDRDGKYSIYDVEDQNYLRGVQEADSAGRVTFNSIFPAAYSGRWPHIHFEVYLDLASATSSDNAITTSQLALPQAICEEVYATDGYATSVRNLARTSLERDNVFSDGYETQLATVTGSVASGLTATLTVGVDS